MSATCQLFMLLIGIISAIFSHFFVYPALNSMLSLFKTRY
uniref:Uncharacterized protein n=1 Tax=Yersinia enterocolitica W22703 TaxID=913028 RepID=F4N7B0_YEREN|nr:unknown protein [Yersinia enterocolitica W22703]